MLVKFFATIRKITGCSRVEVSAEQSLHALLMSLSTIYGSSFRNYVLSSDTKSPGDEIILMVNGRHIDHLEGLHTLLKETDTVSIFPVVAGG